ncbi:tetratricopeptide repeat protein [Aureimonas sp. AU20]|uniref:tetratricopeptide repeat protein n=1 Tax=Aureimonas sp. AU20 TaxID=1349819 RepID=UPI000722AD8D|nr:tetratricopeptide repeat protein [Aureimonas sp. AU20]ALN74909.1 hypothetical protein M673_19470 [Aureimonas sp. AU20]
MSQPPAPSFEQLRAEARGFRAQKRHAEALARLAEALDLRPGDAWTRNDMALEHLSLGQRGGAEALARALTQEKPDFAPGWRTLALVARAEGQHEAALQAFEQAHRCDPRDLWNAHDAGAALRALGRGAEAEAAWLQLAQATPLAHSLRGLAELARERGAGEDALALLRTASLLLPDDPWFAFDTARQRAALGQREPAEAALDALLQARPSFAPAALERARLATTPASIEAALAALETAQALGPEDEALVGAEADLLRRSGRALEAETRLVRFLVRHPASLAVLRALARAARERGDAQAVAAHLKAALAVAPADLALRLEWAVALREAGASDQAEAQLRAITDEPAPPVDALLELYRLRARTEGPEAARSVLDRALALDPAHPRALLLQGDDRRASGDLAGAAAAYDLALEHRPGFYWALMGLALVARMEGRRDEARAFLSQAAEAEPLEAQAQLELAAMSREDGAFEAAQRWLAGIPEATRRRADVGVAEAHLLRAEGRWAEAAGAFEAAAERQAARVETLVDAAEDWMRAGQDGRAEACLARLERAAPNHPALLDARARRALILDDLTAARDLFDRAAAGDPTRLSAWLGAARAEALSGEVEAAFLRLDGVDARFGSRPETASLRADLLRQTGQSEAARAMLGEARDRHPGHAHLWQQALVERVEAGAFAEVEAALSDPPPAFRADAGRRHFVGSLLASARWDFEAAVREGEAAVARLPGDGWVRNRLIHAALLGLDLERAGGHLAALARLEAGSSRLKGKSANPSQSHYGQLYDEFRMDADALSALRPALAEPAPKARLAALRGAVSAFPDSTIAALQLLIELRRQGAHPMVEEMEASHEPSLVPPVLHQFWDEPPVPPDVAAYVQSWRKENDGFDGRIWSRAEAEAYLNERGLDDALAAFRRARQPAMKADLFRLALLGEEGGIYADADDRCLAPIRPLLAGPVGLLTYQEDLGSLGNNVLAARPAHPLVLLARDLASEAVNRGDGDILWLSTGPGLLSRAAAWLLATRPAEVADLRIVSRHTLSRFVAIHCLTGYKSTERHWSRTAFGRAARPPRKA